MGELVEQPPTSQAQPPTPGPRPRVLLIAEAANPEFSSVPLVGWSHSRALAEEADVHVVTQVRNRAAFLRAGLTEGRDFTAIDSERVARPMNWVERVARGGAGKGWTTVMALRLVPYLYFEHLVWRAFRSRLRSGEFDLVHRLTPLSPTLPSIVASRCDRCGVPFVIGPLNGGLPWPAAFDAERRKEREWLSYLRSAYRLAPGYRATRERASAIVVASVTTAEQMPARYAGKVVYIPENGIDPERFPDVDDAPPNGDGRGRPLRVVFLGRLVPYKGPDMLLEAAAGYIKEGRVDLTVIGDGPLRGALEKRTADLGLGERVVFTGWLPHGEVHDYLQRLDVLGFPSVREFGGAAPLEAMAMGMVPIVIDYGGPAEIVSDSSGFRVPLGSRAQTIERVAEALGVLVHDPGRLAPMRRAAIRRARTRFTWSAKAKQVREVYDWVLGRRAEKPDFGMPLHESEAVAEPRAL